MKHYNINQNTDEWLELRRGKFTASLIKDLFMKKRTTAYNNAIYKVVFERLTGEIPELFVTPFMERGKELEPVAREEYERLTFNSVTPGGFYKLNSYVGGSPDGLIKDVGLLEIKCPKYSTHIKYMLNKKLPSEYKYQCYSNLYISKREWLDFISFHPQLDSLIIRVYPDKNIFNEIEIELETAIKTVKNIIRKLQRRKDFNNIKVVRTNRAA